MTARVAKEVKVDSVEVISTAIIVVVNTVIEALSGLKELGNVGKPHWFKGNSELPYEVLKTHDAAMHTGFSITIGKNQPVYVSPESLSSILATYPITQ